MKRISWFIIIFALSQSAMAAPTENLTQIGSATLKKIFWTIYDSELYSKDGIYRGIEPKLALKITYQRKISCEQLINSTRSEWRKQSIYEEKSSEAWLKVLDQIWPDVTQGDVITLYVSDTFDSRFYFNGEPIGEIGDPLFTQHFLAIWLSPQTSYPELRKQLMGES